jgi:hypothetical protein
MLKRAGIVLALMAAAAAAHAQQAPTTLDDILRDVERKPGQSTQDQPKSGERVVRDAAPVRPSTDVTELLYELRTFRLRFQAAETELFGMLPAGSLVSRNRAGAVFVHTPGTDPRAASATEAAAFDVYAKMKQAYEAAQEDGVGAFTPEDQAELDAANSAVAASLPPGGRLRFSSDGLTVTAPGAASRKPEGRELEAIAKRDALIGRLLERARLEAVR